MALSGSAREKEIKKIKKLLESDEEVVLVTRQSRIGLIGGSLVTPNILILTNKKIIVRNPRTLGLREDVLTIPFDRITAIRMGKGIFKGQVMINAPGLTTEIAAFFKHNKHVTEEFGIPGIPKEDAEKIVSYVQQKLSELKRDQGKTVVIQSSSPLDEIKKLKELLDMGIITQEEFEKKKNELLSKI